MKKALINIDYTNDFVADDGKLTCGKIAQELEGYIVQITKEFIDKKDYVVFAIDMHLENDEYHPETKLFPPHNIKGTIGRDLYGSLQSLYEWNRNNNNVYYIDKTRYSAFCGTDLDMQLRARGIEELHLVGVCTDICILHTAVDAYNLGYKLVIHESGVQSFNAQGHEWALTHFKTSLGATIL